MSTQLQVPPVFTLRTGFSNFPIRDWDSYRFYKQTNNRAIISSVSEYIISRSYTRIKFSFVVFNKSKND